MSTRRGNKRDQVQPAVSNQQQKQLTDNNSGIMNGVNENTSSPATTSCKEKQDVKNKGTVNGVVKKNERKISENQQNATGGTSSGVARNGIESSEPDKIIPTSPPFIAFIGNLPFETELKEVELLFQDLQVLNARLALTEGQSRSKGFGYVEFETRESFLQALAMTELHEIGGRTIRIDVAESRENKPRRNRGNRNATAPSSKSGVKTDSPNRPVDTVRNNGIPSSSPAVAKSSSPKGPNRNAKTSTEVKKPAPPAEPRNSNLSNSRSMDEARPPKTSVNYGTSNGGDPKKGSLDKSTKDLNRTMVSLQRCGRLLDEEIEHSYRRIDESFREVKIALDEREKVLRSLMDKTKKEAHQMFLQRQEFGQRLRALSEGADSMSEYDKDDLRLQIKRFVGDRKYDDQLCRTIRFSRDHQRLINEIASFGEVAAVEKYVADRRPVHTESVDTSPISEGSELNNHHSQINGDGSKDHGTAPMPPPPFKGRSRVFRSSAMKPPANRNQGFRGGGDGFRKGGSRPMSNGIEK